MSRMIMFVNFKTKILSMGQLKMIYHIFAWTVKQWRVDNLKRIALETLIYLSLNFVWLPLTLSAREMFWGSLCYGKSRIDVVPYLDNESLYKIMFLLYTPLTVIVISYIIILSSGCFAIIYFHYMNVVLSGRFSHYVLPYKRYIFRVFLTLRTSIHTFYHQCVSVIAYFHMNVISLGCFSHYALPYKRYVMSPFLPLCTAI